MEGVAEGRAPRLCSDIIEIRCFQRVAPTESVDVCKEEEIAALETLYAEFTYPVNNPPMPETPDISQPASYDFTGIAGVDLSQCVSLFHLNSAVLRALISQSQAKMKTRNLYTEILYQLSPSKNINEAIKQYRVGVHSEYFALIRLNNDVEGKYRSICDKVLQVSSHLVGALIEFSPSQIGSFIQGNDEKKEELRKIFKMSKEEVFGDNLEAAVITRVALKDVL